MDLHPEDLIEREMCGDLSPIERGRLEMHAQRCAVCKLERLARADFRRDAEGLDAEIDVQRLLAAVAGRTARGDVSRVASRPLMRRFALVAVAVIGVAGLAAAARWSGELVAAPVATAAVAPAHPFARVSEPPAAVLSEQAVSEAESPLPLWSPPVIAGPIRPVAPLRARRRATSPLARARAAIERPPFPMPAAPIAAGQIVEAASDASTIFRRANAARAMGDHVRAGELYRRLSESFATSCEARASLPMFGRMLLDDGNASGALGRFDEALRVGASALREDVMVGRALALGRLGRADNEAQAWSALLDASPNSVHADRARKRLLDLATGR